MTAVLPRLLEPELLEQHLGETDLLIVDLSEEAQYRQSHIPGSVHVRPTELMAGQYPAVGKLPSAEKLQVLMDRLGLTPQTRVVVCDDEGGGWAGRFIWTLDIVGHELWSYLNGGMVAWCNEDFPLTDELTVPAQSDYPLALDPTPSAQIDDILHELTEPGVVIWDARSKDEYDGVYILSQRGGHIPGAIHCEWTTLMDANRNLRIREDAAELLAAAGLGPDRKIITHCQSHHRSGFTYLVARLLGYPHIQAYPGSWSEWGNLPNTPVEP